MRDRDRTTLRTLATGFALALAIGTLGAVPVAADGDDLVERPGFFVNAIGGKRIKTGTRLAVGHNGTTVEATVTEEHEENERVIEFAEPIQPHLNDIGETPLPPYIKRTKEDGHPEEDLPPGHCGRRDQHTRAGGFNLPGRSKYGGYRHHPGERAGLAEGIRCTTEQVVSLAWT